MTKAKKKADRAYYQRHRKAIIFAQRARNAGRKVTLAEARAMLT
jgi:hypothetical protein